MKQVAHIELARLVMAIAASLLAGCSSTPPPPDWQTNAYSALRDFSQAYLVGNNRVANLEFERARGEIASTGRADLLARAELVQCAARAASLEIERCVGFDALAKDAGAPERAYAAFLNSQLIEADVAALPEQYRPLASAKDAPTKNAALAAIKDPLSRLVGASALLQSGQLAPSGIAVAVNAASEQGWRRPLLAWLGVQLKRAQAMDDVEVAGNIQRRIHLVAGTTPQQN
jgi:hypothetical protein